MVFVFAEFAEIGPVIPDRPLVPQVFYQVRHLLLDRRRHPPNALERLPLGDDFIHKINVIKK